MIESTTYELLNGYREAYLYSSTNFAREESLKVYKDFRDFLRLTYATFPKEMQDELEEVISKIETLSWSKHDE